VRYKEQYKQYPRPTSVLIMSFTRLVPSGVSSLEFLDHGLCVDKRGEAHEQPGIDSRRTRTGLHHRSVTHAYR
jgi:hypothetical protein